MSQEKSSPQKRNQIFNYLYAIAIIMVIDDHCSTRIGFLSSIFPYNSFYMPMFVFVSGYFYKKTSIKENISHKFKKLFIPYAVWNVIMMMAACMIDRLFGVNWVKWPSLNSIPYFIFLRPLTSINGASWFIIMLFWVSILTNIIYFILGKENAIKDLLLGLVFCILGFLSVFLCSKGYYKKRPIWLFGLRTVFYMQFYFLGYLFHQYFERIIIKCNKLIVCSFCVVINVNLILLYGKKINFYSTTRMDSFHYWFLPLITSITGILFYYEIMRFLSDKIGKNKYIEFVANNTLTILETHLVFANIPNLYIYTCILKGSTKYPNFDVNAVFNGAWYRYSADSRLISFFLGLAGSILAAYLLGYLQKRVKLLKKV